MRKHLCLILLAAFFLSIQGYTQENLTFMHYNLLYYGKHYGSCDAANNGLQEKTAQLRKVFSALQPDVFSVNELDGAGADPEADDGLYLLDHALNVEGTTRYRMAPYDSTFTANTLFYNSQKLTLYAHHPISFQVGFYPKIFNAYTFYYHADDLASATDTTFFTCVVVHLKAGNDTRDEGEREQEAQLVMDHIAHQIGGENFLLAGDLNVYQASEGAFQNFIHPDDPAYSFYDPVDQTGHWHSNSDYRHYHTQSTHLSGGCHAGGGMDDRFDFILLSSSIMEGQQDIRYIRDSYRTIGQDGSSFNQSLNVQTNAAVSQELAAALHDFSDHLPVSLQVRVNRDPATWTSVDTLYHSPALPTGEDSVEVYARLNDPGGQISRVRLLWGKESGQYTWDTIMTWTGDYYQAALPPYDAGTSVFLRVKGYDAGESVVLASEEISYPVEEASVSLPYHPENRSGAFEVVHPAGEQLQLLTGKNLTGEYVVQIGDMTGRIHIQRKLNPEGNRRLFIDVSTLGPGIYWIRLSNSKSTMVRKFIKQ